MEKNEKVKNQSELELFKIRFLIDINKVSENLYQISFERTSKIFPPSKSLLDYTYNMDLYFYITSILP